MNVWTYWKCPSCGAIIRGDNRDCPNCATPVPAGTKYLMPDDPEVARAIENGTAYITSHAMVEEAVTQVSEDKKSDKANWVCDYCGYQNRFENTVCEGCGAPKEESKRDYFTPVPETPKPQSYTPTRRPSGRFKKLIPIIAVILFLIWLFTPVTRKTVISGFEWMRSIAVDEYQLCHEDDWSLPAGATQTSTKQEIHHYDHVIDHYETKTRQVSEQVLDGYDTEYRTETYEDPVYKDVPVYQTKYYYDIDRWITVSSIDTGGKDHDPKWGESDLPESVSDPVYGDKKLGQRSERYYIYFKDKKGNEQKEEYNFSEWNDYKLGDEITYKSFRFSNKPL